MNEAANARKKLSRVSLQNFKKNNPAVLRPLRWHHRERLQVQAVTITVAGQTYNGQCTQSELYSSNAPEKDWALCLMEKDVPVKRYETVNTDPSRLKLKTELLLTGFGCSTSAGTGGNDGFYRIGEATITKLPENGNADILTSGGAALCFGDSGGGAFLFNADKKSRVQVSVNSRIQVLESRELTKISYLSSISTDEANSFLNNWAQKNGALICGIHHFAVNVHCHHTRRQRVTRASVFKL